MGWGSHTSILTSCFESIVLFTPEIFTQVCRTIAHKLQHTDA